jgi:hypothetical protein
MERIATESTKLVLEHTYGNKHFIINMASTHNTAGIREALPASLIRPTPTHGNTADRLRAHQKSARESLLAKALRSEDLADARSKKKQRMRSRAVNPGLGINNGALAGSLGTGTQDAGGRGCEGHAAIVI